MDRKNGELDSVSYSIIDFVKTFPEIAHVKEAEKYEYVLTNQNNLEIFGFSREEELIGKNVFALAKIMGEKWPPDYAEKVHQFDQQVAKTKKPLFVKPDEFLNKNGFVVIHSFMKIPLFNFDQQLQAILTLVFDSTQQESLESLRSVYRRLHNSIKVADQKFLQFIGVDEYYSSKITKRELDFVLALMRHKVLKSVAKELDISVKAVEALCLRLRKTLNCATTSELIHYFTEKINL